MSADKSSPRRLRCVHLLFCLISLLSGATSDDLQTLLAIKSSFQNSKADVFNTWVPKNSACNFTGITCNANGSVKGIELAGQGLAGEVPFDSICELQSLETLSLGRNRLSGAVTEDLRKCVKLKYLDLGNNLFSGSVPDLSPLSGLVYLHMNNSGFSGTFPFTSLSNMTGLVALSLGDNPFELTPFPDMVLELAKLNWLYLSNCSIEGQIPSAIGNLTELINLEIADNFLIGKIPPGISKLKKLWQLELYYNDLTGELPAGFGNLTNLELFDASHNHLSGDLSELKSLNQLVTLQLYENEFSGEVPPEFGDFKKLVNLSLYANSLTGPLPQKLGSWAEFDFIDVSENFLTGPIPKEMCKHGKMRKLLILQNKFTGNIPASYADCTSLIRVRVGNNSLSGVVPSGIWGLPNVGLIDIGFNQFEGSITSDIKNAKTLAQIMAGNNRLSGELPQEISGATGLVSIDLSYNQFSGNIPATMGELKQLNNLHLQNNRFSGPIPENIASCSALSDVNMAYNSLSGEIPASLGSLPNLNSLNLSRNELSGQIPESLSSLTLSLFDLFAGNNGLCSQSIKQFRPCSSDPGSSKNLRRIMLCFAAGALTLLLLSIGCIIYSKRSQKDGDRSLKEHSWDIKPFHVLTFTEDEILDSIKQENLIGKGGSGSVYRVPLSNGKEVAVKHVWNSGAGSRKSPRSSTPMISKRASANSRQFDAEVQTLSSIRHVNVVKLFCSITSEDSSLLVYEYLPNGSLWDRLHGTCRKMAMDWEARWDIAVGAARGLEYLHHGCDRPVVHRDVKSSNILLDELMKPRIADFGLAKIVQANSSKDSSSSHVVAGTLGYIAPEYGYTYKVNEKSDVYSFGVVLMELVTGKRPIEPEFGENRDIVSWLSSNLKSRESVLGMVDCTIHEAFKEDAIKVLRIGVLCTARLPALRPSMRSVVQMLEDAEPCKLVGIILSKDGSSKKWEGKGENDDVS
ncbi:Non-specific serine/threonine protein kinase [Bertholletia excelsa]